MKSIILLGALLGSLGVLGLANPIFTTSQTKDVVILGGLKIHRTVQSMHAIPSALSVSALVLGVVLIFAGLYLFASKARRPTAGRA
jgi:uncharacterized BrkB/YihY/UPF0761 family membrane protein